MYLKDITNDFIKHSTPGKGHIYIEEGIDRISHKQEIETVHWLLDNFGGEITILKERNTFNIKYADYRWNGKLWELKKVSNKLSLDNGLRKAILVHGSVGPRHLHRLLGQRHSPLSPCHGEGSCRIAVCRARLLRHRPRPGHKR